MRVAGLASADEAGLPAYKAQLLLVPQPLGSRQCEDTFVDALIARRSAIFSRRDIVNLCQLQVGEAILKGLSDLVAVGGFQAVYLWPHPQCPGVQLILALQSLHRGQKLVAQHCCNSMR